MVDAILSSDVSVPTNNSIELLRVSISVMKRRFGARSCQCALAFGFICEDDADEDVHELTGKRHEGGDHEHPEGHPDGCEDGGGVFLAPGLNSNRTCSATATGKNICRFALTMRGQEAIPRNNGDDNTAIANNLRQASEVDPFLHLLAARATKVFECAVRSFIPFSRPIDSYN